MWYTITIQTPLQCQGGVYGYSTDNSYYPDGADKEPSASATMAWYVLNDDGGESSACVLGIYRYFHGVARLYSYIFKQWATAWH
ncbi:MAG: hypothetical protein D8B38_03755 [Candidatus Saccharimonas sp.]|nr:MAG: hypothetical protein D8B38_03755 [Candidatus Saccharimonas sp.]